jgi:hypothetical protein
MREASALFLFVHADGFPGLFGNDDARSEI